MDKLRIYIIFIIASSLVIGATITYTYTFIKSHNLYFSLLCLLLITTNSVFIGMNYVGARNSIERKK